MYFIGYGKKIKKTIPNSEKVSLKEYFAHLPKAVRTVVVISAPKEEFIQEVSRICGKHPLTVRRWAYGYIQPCKADREKIADLLGCPVEVLFPPMKEENNG